MIFLVLIIMVVGLYFMILSFLGMIMLFHSSWVTRKERAAVKRWKAKGRI